jgi:hypothetical protein
MVASRVVTLALFATCFRLELFIFLGLHWALMTLWIVMMVRSNLVFKTSKDKKGRANP